MEEQLQSYDPHLYLMWNLKNGEHVIMDGLLEMSIMKIPQIGFEQLDSRVVNHIKRIHTANGFSAVQTVENTEKKTKRRRLNDQRKIMRENQKKHFGTRMHMAVWMAYKNMYRV